MFEVEKRYLSNRIYSHDIYMHTEIIFMNSALHIYLTAFGIFVYELIFIFKTFLVRKTFYDNFGTCWKLRAPVISWRKEFC